MNKKVTVSFINKSGIAEQISEYHMNSDAAYKAGERIIKGLGYDVEITSMQVSPAVKHIELVPDVPFPKRDNKYSEVK